VAEQLDREDVVVLLGTPTEDASRLYAMTVTTGDPSWAGALAGYAAAGATWWLENLNDLYGPPEELRALVRAGPPT